METRATLVFDTLIGNISVIYGAGKIFRVALARDDESISAPKNAQEEQIIREFQAAIAGVPVTWSFEAISSGTTFQQKVFWALRNIPHGHAASYHNIAGIIGHPRAVRAVWSACRVNPTPIIVPCHRVIRSDGSPGQFAWGAWVKKELLAREKVLRDKKK